MRFLSVCSGIEAASVAWEPLGWKAVGFSEIEPFPCAVLAHRFPNTPNYGSLTEYASWPIAPGSIDLLVGGTPCQSFSVAGLRKGMADPRGNLALVFLGLADRVKPRWIVWENVPGVLSSNGGRDFGSFLGALEQLGYGWAYRVLDAQHFGVPQRRRRVFVVACLGAGGWESAAKVLFEPESLSGDPAKGRKKGQGVAADAQGGAGASFQSTVGCLDTECGAGKLTHQSAVNGHIIPSRVGKSNQAQSTTDDINLVEAGEANTLNNFDLGDTRTIHAVVSPHIVQASELRLRGQITPQDTCPTLLAQTKSGDNDPLAVHAITFQPGNLRREAGADPSTTTTTTLKASAGDQTPHVACFYAGQGAKAGSIAYNENVSPTLKSSDSGTNRTPTAMLGMAVRRLTPTECMRLQGFPDDWARIPWKGKPADQCPDGPQYKAAGNSMAVPVMRWIGSRIAAVEQHSTQPTK